MYYYINLVEGPPSPHGALCVPPSGFQVLVPWDEWRRFQIPVPQ